MASDPREQRWNISPEEVQVVCALAMGRGDVVLVYPIGNGRFNVATVAPETIAGVTKYAALLGVDWLRALVTKGDDGE